MNEDDSAARRENKIGIAGKVAPMKSETEAKRVNKPTNDKLGLGILRANERHALAALAF